MAVLVAWIMLYLLWTALGVEFWRKKLDSPYFHLHETFELLETDIISE